MLFITVIVALSLLYAIKILRYRIGWDKISQLEVNVFTPKLSVIIALRNEESQVLRLITELKKQLYPTDKYQVIIINDHSEDSTLELLNKEVKCWRNLKLLSMNEGEYGKKKAIVKGIKSASGEIIISTDADCSFNANWLKKMVSYFYNEKIKLLSGPVGFHQKRGLFHSLQTLEFFSLIGSGAGAIGIGRSIFCNGANMAYRKDVFMEVNDFANDKVVSGDDVFLLHRVKQKYPNGIAFAKDEDAIVLTNPETSFKSLLNQRKRWTAKSCSFNDWHTLYTSLLVLFTNLLTIVLFVFSFVHLHYLNYFLSFMFVKFLVDLILLTPVLGFFKRKDLIKWILPFEMFYSLCIVLIVILSFTNPFEWKRRVHRR